MNPTCLCPGQKSGTGVHVLPQSYWYELLYGTILLALCLVVCLVGASIYAKATFLIFLIVAAVLGTILVSFFATRPLGVPIRMPHHNSSETENGNFTGFSLATLRENLGGEGFLQPYLWSPAWQPPPSPTCWAGEGWHGHLGANRGLLEGVGSSQAQSKWRGVVCPVVALIWGQGC